MNGKIKVLFKVLSSNALAQLIVIVTTPILTRLYDISDFGVLGVVNSILLTLGVIGCLRYDQLMFNVKDIDRWSEIFSKGLIVSVIFLILVLVVFAGLYALNVISSSYYVVIPPLLVFFFSLSQLLSSSLSVYGKYTIISVSLVVKAIVAFLSQFTLSFNSAGLIIGVLISQISQAALLYAFVRMYTDISFKTPRNLDISKNSIMSTCQSLANSISSQLPSFFVPFKFGVEAMGYYSMALRLTYLPITFFTNAIRPIILGELNGHRKQAKYVYNTMLYGSVFLLSLAIVGVCLINLFARDFFIFYAGDTWAFSGDISGALSVWILLAFSNVLSTAYLTVYERFKELLLYDAFLLLSRFLVVLYYLYDNCELIEFVEIYSLLGFAFNLTIIIYAVRLARSEYYLSRDNI